ncbi:hypothetical protein BH23ACI1_BH23ACI1_19370 [soil metagenome]
MVPLLGYTPAVGGYAVLDQALALKAFEITEVSEHGSVPELRVVNWGAEPVLIVDGEELVGAKQNRVVNLSILVAGRSELTMAAGGGDIARPVVPQSRAHGPRLRRQRCHHGDGLAAGP